MALEIICIPAEKTTAGLGPFSDRSDRTELNDLVKTSSKSIVRIYVMIILKHGYSGLMSHNEQQFAATRDELVYTLKRHWNLLGR
jgi:hypothetical protein